jgi:hypothetical protein
MTLQVPRRLILLVLLVSSLLVPIAAFGQASAGTPPPPPAQSPDQPDPDLQVVAGEPDFTLGALPTSLRMPAGKFSFRFTHRFERPISSGTTGDFFASFFGFDSSAQTGLELRYGVASGTEMTVHRTNDRTIQFLGQHELVRQRDTKGLTVDLVGAVEGLNNFSRNFATTVGGIVGHRLGDHGAVYAEPLVVFKTSLASLPANQHNQTVVIGLGTRMRLGASHTYVVAEFAPRIGGYKQGVNHVSVGIEKRVGGHVFQLNVSNNLGTTLAQVARGGLTNSNWFIGFNLTRRFW